MSYFQPRDFDAGQPMLPQLSAMRKFKSYVGLKGAFRKFEYWLDDFETLNLMEADASINWEETKVISLK
ncbi:MAG: DUF3473 domain-containing protein [Prolixibacteraceae bacterium]|nr:DUF3473 domain-containing protein [Prolixibacteraceae bacterium]